ncbi:hypothetical protein H2198_004814 [Neophaeococcomyces mojaviensis]|uniref:Uncharacterized protein n=1 Tax=Neophaeococcomyces mojaviensis TaxID=3383035 RepID=A0ACC3A7L3_9EURO|nr:hypothetical protein H2198_004814 [Knufia sp. JES_112]
MDAEDIIALFVFSSILCMPFILVLSITGCIAYSNTRTWQKEKARRLHDAESRDPLVSKSQSSFEEIEDFLDSEDEAEYREKQEEEAEEEAEWKLTTKQKFNKEFKKCWTGKAKAEKEREKKEKEERRKIAKEVVREMMRLEKKRSKKLQLGVAGSVEDAVLPSYKEE